MVHLVDDDNFPECIHVINDEDTGVTGIIALHSTVLGPAAGGCRFWHYETQADLITDAVRLARGMTYKNALAGLPFGGGKAVLQQPKGDFDRRRIFRVFGEAVAALDSAYVTAEDVGTSIADMREVRRHTTHVAGLDAQPGRAGGDPSPWTALGVFQCMEAAAREVLKAELKNVTVAVQGVGSVGRELCRLLNRAGAKLVIADIDETRCTALAHQLGAKAVGIDEILAVGADILAPCALGGILNAQTIPRLNAGLICGAANNQLATPADGLELMNQCILYAPDYVVNAGGIINASAEYLGETIGQVQARVAQIAPRLLRILGCASEERRPPGVAADTLAQQIIAASRKREAG